MNTKKVLIILFILSLCIRIIAVFISPIKIWDETVYANLGHDLKLDPLDYSFENHGWSDFVPGEYPFGWPNAGYRAPLLPYTLSIFYAINDSEFFISLFIPLIGALTVVLIYFLSKELFNEKIALYSSLFLTFLPLHVIFSGKILTDVFATFLLILSVLFFWKGFEKGNDKYKILFGFSIALSFLARYTIIFILVIFPIYLLVKHRNLSFMKDKYLWICVGILFCSLLPWLFYSISTYNNPIGALIHAKIAAAYWGGTQPWYFFFQYSWQMFSILSFVFLASLILILINKKLRSQPKIILLILWFFIFFIIINFVPHKEDRFLLPIIPPLIIISSLMISKIKIYPKIIIISIVFILILSTADLFYQNIKNSYSESNVCFLKGNEFLKSIEKDALIITEESSIIYFYAKRETHFYPSPFSLDSLKDLIENYYNGRVVYIFFTSSIEKYQRIKEILDSNFEIVFRCPESENLSVVYKY